MTAWPCAWLSWHRNPVSRESGAYCHLPARSVPRFRRRTTRRITRSTTPLALWLYLRLPDLLAMYEDSLPGPTGQREWVLSLPRARRLLRRPGPCVTLAPHPGAGCLAGGFTGDVGAHPRGRSALRCGLGRAAGPLALADRALGLSGKRGLRRRAAALALQRLR